MGVEQFQAIQRTADEFTINMVVDKKYDRASEVVIMKRLSKLLKMRLKMEFIYVDHIPRESSGKIRLVKSEVSR